MATGTKFSPKTKYIALKYQNIKSNVKIGQVDISYTPTDQKLADLLKNLFQTRVFKLFVTCFVVEVTILDRIIRYLSKMYSRSIFFFLQKLNGSIQELLLLFLQQLNELKYQS